MSYSYTRHRHELQLHTSPTRVTATHVTDTSYSYTRHRHELQLHTSQTRVTGTGMDTTHKQMVRHVEAQTK